MSSLVGDRFFVDTNILIYAHDTAAGEKHLRAQALLEELWQTGAGVISTQILQARPAFAGGSAPSTSHWLVDPPLRSAPLRPRKDRPSGAAGQSFSPATDPPRWGCARRAMGTGRDPIPRPRSRLRRVDSAVTANQELAVNLRRKAKKPLSAKATRDVISDYLAWQVVVNDAAAILEALEIESRYHLSFWDALVIQAAQAGGAALVYSEDLSDGQWYGTVRVSNPLAD